jgi:hypothetical protein
MKINMKIIKITSINIMINQAVNTRKELWKKVSKLERTAVELLTLGDEVSVDLAYKNLAESVCLKKDDPFLQLAASYGEASLNEDTAECERLLTAMKIAGVPPHIAGFSFSSLFFYD